MLYQFQRVPAQNSIWIELLPSHIHAVVVVVVVVVVVAAAAAAADPDAVPQSLAAASEADGRLEWQLRQ